MERQNITKRTSSGRAVKASKGGYSGGRPPYGYRSHNGVLTIVEDEADVVREVFALKASGYTYKQIVDKLNTDGRKARSGSLWAISTLQVILGNENLYKGLYRYGKNSEWVEGAHKAILKD